jgi:hypothetical protein
MANQGLKIDQLDPLPLPVLATDELIVARSGDLKRMAVRHFRGGISNRKGDLVPPQAANFPTWVNQSATSITDLPDGLRLERLTALTGDSLSGVVRPLPAGSWDVKLCCVRGWMLKNWLIGGLWLRESSTGKIITWGFGHQNDADFVVRWNSPTSFHSILKSGYERPLKIWLRARLGAGTIEFHRSPDGINWALFYIVAQATPFTVAPDQWGAFINANNSQAPQLPMRMDVLDWSE